MSMQLLLPLPFFLMACDWLSACIFNDLMSQCYESGGVL